MYQEHESQIHGTTRHTFYGQMMSNQMKAEEHAAVAALQFLCSCYGFEITDINYREAQFHMMRVRQAKRRVRTLKILRVTTMHALRNACHQASDVLPIEVQNPDTIYPRPEDTTYAAPPRTRAEMLAFVLSNIITNVVQPNTLEE